MLAQWQPCKRAGWLTWLILAASSLGLSPGDSLRIPNAWPRSDVSSAGDSPEACTRKGRRFGRSRSRVPARASRLIGCSISLRAVLVIDLRMYRGNHKVPSNKLFPRLPERRLAIEFDEPNV